MRLGRDLEPLLWDIAKRIDAPRIQVLHHRAVGASARPAAIWLRRLANLGDVLRRRRTMLQKAPRRVASEARTTAGILGCLPLLVTGALMMTSPQYIMLMFEDPRGVILIGIAIGMLITGITIMVKLARFDMMNSMDHFTADKFDLDRYLPYGVSVADVIALLAGRPRSSRRFSPCGTRCGRVRRSSAALPNRHRKESLRQTALAPRRQRERLTPAGLMHEAVKRLNLLRSKHATEARTLLMRAGLRSRDAMVRYLFARLCLPLVCAMLEMADAYTIHLLPVPPQYRFLGALGAAVCRIHGAEHGAQEHHLAGA